MKNGRGIGIKALIETVCAAINGNLNLYACVYIYKIYIRKIIIK